MTAHVNSTSCDAACRRVGVFLPTFLAMLLLIFGFLLFEENGSHHLALVKYLQVILTSFVFVPCFSDVDF